VHGAHTTYGLPPILVQCFLKISLSTFLSDHMMLCCVSAGASLVPVLCLGEQDVVGPMELGYRFWKWEKPTRPYPVHVVFGKVSCPKP
jgi:hypothetical protein